MAGKKRSVSIVADISWKRTGTHQVPVLFVIGQGWIEDDCKPSVLRSNAPAHAVAGFVGNPLE